MLQWEGGTTHLKDSGGQRMLARWLDAPNCELHSRELAQAMDGVVQMRQCLRDDLPIVE